MRQFIKENKISSGIPGFDELTEGGFERQSMNVVAGGVGSGKTIFSMQFLIEGLKREEKCLFVTFEENKKEFYQNMWDFGWDLEKYEKEKNFFFIEYSPEKIRSMIEEGGGEIESIMLKNKISRLVMDTITSFEILFEDELEKRDSIRNLLGIIRKWGATSILTLQEDPKKEEEKEDPLELEADSIIMIYFLRKGEERERTLEILKMRGTNHSKRIHDLEMTKRGIIVRR